MKVFNFSKIKIYTLIALTVFCSITPTNVLANKDGYYSRNDIFFYDEDATENCAVNGTFNSELPAETVAKLDAEGIKQKAQREKSRYEYASKATGVPWQAIAAIHYRETGFSGNYQDRSLQNGDNLASKGTSYINVDGQIVVDDPKQDAVNATNHFIAMAKSVYGIDPSSSNFVSSGSVDDWGRAFLAYNRGYIYKWVDADYDISPYVMNGYDDKHMNMTWPNIPGETVSGKKDSNFGALTIMAYLGDIDFGSDCESGGAVRGNIVKTALNFAVDHPVENGTTQPEQAKEEYRKAIVEFNETAAKYPEITDCGRFVATVMRASGSDSEFPTVGVGGMRDYMAKSSKYQKIEKANASNILDTMKPGDIITITGGHEHIMLYSGENQGNYAVDASYTQRIPSVRGMDCVIWMFQRDAEVWRLKS